MCFFCPFSILVTLLGEKGAVLCSFLFAMHTLICVTFSLLFFSSVGGWLRLLLVALPGLFCLPLWERTCGMELISSQFQVLENPLSPGTLFINLCRDFMHSQDLESVDSTKYLDVSISKGLSWNTHITIYHSQCKKNKNRK